MSEFNTMGFDPMVPLGNPAAPPPLNRADYLLPPLPKPTTPVEPRPSAPTIRSMDVVTAPMSKPDADAAEAPKPPLPGRMAWVPEVLRLMTKPTKQKGIFAAGIASLVAGASVAQWMWPTKPLPTAETAAVEPAAVPGVQPLLGTMVPSAPMDTVPPVVLPKFEAASTALVLPALDLPKSDLPPLNLPPLPKTDTNVKRAGGIDAPPVPAAVPVATPSAPQAPALVVPSAPTMAPLPTPPVAAPIPAPSTVPVTPAVPLPGAPPMPALAPPMSGLELPKVDITKVELPKVEAVLPKAETLPKVEIGAPAMPVLKPNTGGGDGAMISRPFGPDAGTVPLKTEPTFVKEGTTPKPVPLPTMEMPPEPRPLNATRTITPTPAPTITPSTTAPPREDFDVDVHYATATDNYSSISKQHLGDDRYAEALRAYNANRNVVNGQPVDVPPIHVLRKQYASLIASPRLVTPAGGEAVPVGRSGNGLRSYDIPAGGLTWKEIAKKSLGDENLWGQVWELNPRMRADEAVPAGTRIKLPGDSRIGE